jgi:hypothetical protein
LRIGRGSRFWQMMHRSARHWAAELFDLFRVMLA